MFHAAVCSFPFYDNIQWNICAGMDVPLGYNFRNGGTGSVFDMTTILVHRPLADHTENGLLSPHLEPYGELGRDALLRCANSTGEFMV